MAIVLDSHTLPQGYPRNRWYNDLGSITGAVAKLLMAKWLGGDFQRTQSPASVTPQTPGTLSFPSGASTPTSPLEMAQIQQMGGVPTTRGDIEPLSSGGSVGATYNPPMKWETVQKIINDLNVQQAQADLQKQQQALDPNSVENKYRQAYTGYLNRIPSESTQNPAQQTFYKEGDIIERGGKRWKIVGTDTDGMPLVEPE